MGKKKIEVTEERIREMGATCSTLAEEYWLAMTPEQQTLLEEERRRTLSNAADRVLRNERAAGISGKMEVLRGIPRANDDAIRDLYFGIHDDAARIKAIGDFLDYERLRRSYETAEVYEAHYRRHDVLSKLIHGWPTWPEVKRFALVMAIVIAVGYFVGLIFSDAPTSFGTLVGVYVAMVFAYGIYWEIHLRRMESQYFVLWEIKKLKYGIGDDPDVLTRKPRSYDLFTESEQQTGRAVERRL